MIILLGIAIISHCCRRRKRKERIKIRVQKQMGEYLGHPNITAPLKDVGGRVLMYPTAPPPKTWARGAPHAPHRELASPAKVLLGPPPPPKTNSAAKVEIILKTTPAQRSEMIHTRKEDNSSPETIKISTYRTYTPPSLRIATTDVSPVSTTGSSTPSTSAQTYKLPSYYYTKQTDPAYHSNHDVPLPIWHAPNRVESPASTTSPPPFPPNKPWPERSNALNTGHLETPKTSNLLATLQLPHPRFSDYTLSPYGLATPVSVFSISTVSTMDSDRHTSSPSSARRPRQFSPS